MSSDLKVLIYTYDEGLQNLLSTLFSLAGFEQDENLSSDLSVCISTDINQLNQLSDSFECFKFIVVMANNTSPKFKIGIEEKDEIEAQKDALSNTHKTTHHDENNLLEYVKQLNYEWLNAHYVYIQSVISIEQIFGLMLSSIGYKY